MFSRYPRLLTFVYEVMMHVMYNEFNNAHLVSIEYDCNPSGMILSAFIAGTHGCVFIDNETHERGVTKCTTGEAWSAFSWHHSSVFHCQWTYNQVFLLLSHMLI